MTNHKQKAKKKRVELHRIREYEKAINKVIDGLANPEYATERFNKLKEIRGK